MDSKWYSPKKVFEEYRKAQEVKAGLGARGLFEQSKLNERFYVGDQWSGAKTGADKPLVRYNLIKRIGEYKMALIGSSAIAVQYSAEGVPNTKYIKKKVRKDIEVMRQYSEQGLPPEEMPQPQDENERVNLVMSAMSDYFKTTAERLKFDDLKMKALRKAYISGTGILYTYWDERVKTGLYADLEKKSAIEGDIRCEVLDIENVCFGDSTMESIQEQPYIIIAQRKSVDELKRTARRNRRPAHEVEAIKPDRDYNGYMAGDRAKDEPHDSRKVTVLTKFYKEWDEKGNSFKILAVEVVEGAVIRAPWDIAVRLYPLSKIVWEERANSAYGDSEVTYLVPNQIAVNRAVTACTWSVMMNGMPIMVVNGDVVTSPITNEPGQVVKVYGDAQNVSTAIRYVQPPNASGQFNNLIESLVGNTLNSSGANNAALGDMRADNTSAIVALREASTAPLQLMKNRFHSFVEDTARIFAEFWVSMYGTRALKIEDKEGEWYMTFDSSECRELMITARVDVGEGGTWSEIQTIQTLDALRTSQTIDILQYLERMPKGIIPDIGGLIDDIKEQMAAQQLPQTPDAASDETETQDSAPDFAAIAQQLPENYRQEFMQMPPQAQEAVMQQLNVGGV